ncbi:MAG: hypothetical protein JSS02_03960, partial [Planctomycetes bacterium]|nr:hypothetical protein [Planctomycetota bacterium]
MMPHSADNSPTQPHAGLEPEIELEPTFIGDIDDTDPSEYSESGTDSLEGWSRAPSNSSEMTNLLRSRLRSATGFVAIAYLVFLVYALVNLESAYGLMIFSVVLRGLSAGGIFG